MATSRGDFKCPHCGAVVTHVASPDRESFLGEFIMLSGDRQFLYACDSCGSRYFTKCLPPQYDADLIREVYEEVNRGHGQA